MVPTGANPIPHINQLSVGYESKGDLPLSSLFSVNDRPVVYGGEGCFRPKRPAIPYGAAVLTSCGLVPGARPLQSAHEPDWWQLVEWEEAFMIP
jgi:hypothetical protein